MGCGASKTSTGTGLGVEATCKNAATQCPTESLFEDQTGVQTCCQQVVKMLDSRIHSLNRRGNAVSAARSQSDFDSDAGVLCESFISAECNSEDLCSWAEPWIQIEQVCLDVVSL